MQKAAKDTSTFIAGFPSETQALLNRIRAIIRKAAPGATETISYGIPTFVLEGNLVHFSGYKSHIGFYPGAGGIEAFKKELSAYVTSKGTVQFPLDKSLPAALITRIVRFRVQQNLEKAKTKKEGKKTKAASPALKSKKPTGEEQVKAYLEKLDPAVKSEIDTVRKIIKQAGPELSERIKWNAPSYYYKEDILTFGPYKTHKLLLVFHHPAIVKIKSGLLEGSFKDRRLVHFNSKEEAVKNIKELTRIIREIIQLVGKK